MNVISRTAVLLAALAVCPTIATSVAGCAVIAAPQPGSIPDAALPQPGSAPGAVLPELPVAGATLESLAPKGWTIEQRHQADFNGDGRADALLLLRGAAAEGATPPRILLVALATAKPSGYARAAANAQLIPRDQSGAVEDPMAEGEITVRPRGFDLKIGMMPGTGSYLAATMRFRFGLEGNCFRLIGYDRNETHRGTLDTRDVSVNFLTATVVTQTGNAATNKTETRRSRLDANPRRCLPDLPSGWTFDPTAAAR